MTNNQELKSKLKGCFTALITPMKNGKIDEESFCNFVEWQIQQGIQGLVPCGTTGESPTLDHDEHNKVIELCVKQAKNRVPIIAGTGSNATHEAISMTKYAASLGVDAALIVTPYYNKPTMEGIYQHFKAINDSVDIPLIIYNVPGRTITDIDDKTIARLASLKNVVGIKDATGDLARIDSLRALLGDDFIYISGDDFTSLEFNKKGGQGSISVTANVLPKMSADMQTLSFAGKWDEAQIIDDTLLPVHEVMFIETSPIPAKYAVSFMGKCSTELRLPLCEPSSDSKKKIEQVIKTLI